MRVVLPILYNTEETTMMENLEIPIKIEDCELRDVIFYHIDSIGDSLDDEGKPTGGCTINSGGELFFCPWSKEKVDSLIHPKTQI